MGAGERLVLIETSWNVKQDVITATQTAVEY